MKLILKPFSSCLFLSKVSLKILKYVFIALGSNDYFEQLFSYQTEHTQIIKEQSNIIYQTLISKK